MSNRNCCIPGCTNTSLKSKAAGKMTRFYSFPCKPWQRDKRDAWIRFTKRINRDGTPWVPTQNSFICSEHFQGGQKSEHPLHQNYLPTIFPSEKNSRNKDNDHGRFKRAMLRSSRKSQSGNSGQDKSAEGVTAVKTSCQPSASTNANPSRKDQSTYVQESMIDIHIDPNVYLRNASRQPCFRGYESVKGNERALRDLTGVSTGVFNILLSLLPPAISKISVLSRENKLLLSLMKMKSGITFTSLAVILSVDDSVISRAFYSTVMNLYQATSNWIIFPSKEAVMDTMPETFKEGYQDCRVIIDCTELRTETPSTVEQKVHMYSNYKGCFTAKYLIGITPRGFVSFLSKGYGGRATDSFITNDCGILDLLEAGDTVMADKGFPNVNFQDGIIIVMPPFSKGKNYQFSAKEVDQTYKIASLRIHVERAIQRIKIFKILTTTIPINLLRILDYIVHVCCVISNLSSPIIK